MTATNSRIASTLLPLCLAFMALATPVAAQEVEVHMWSGGDNLMSNDPELFRSMLTFAKRHGIVPYQSGNKDTVGLRAFFDHTTEIGIERTWLEVGPGKDATVQEFVEDPSKRAAVVQRFRDIGRIYNSYYPEFGRITLFDEAPLGGFGQERVNGVRDYYKDVEKFREYAPEAFAILYRALKEEMPHVEVGVFLHHPHNASEEMAGEWSFIDEFMAKADALGATPDFIYSDVYRGWLARGYGTERVNDYITDVVAHIRAVGERYGAEAYQLGQVHTIKLGHTPSRWEIDTNVEAMMAGNPHGLGWYWPNYSATNHLLVNRDPGTSEDRGYDVSFRPFVPNSQGRIGPAGSVIGTSRDRFVYSYLRLLEAAGSIEPRERFDLWLYGHDFDHTEHDVYIRAVDGEWEFLGAINPQQDASGYVAGAKPERFYSYNDTTHAVLFHALDRKRFLSDGQVEVRIGTDETSDGSTLSAVYALPYRATRNYLTEAEATQMILDHPRWMSINSLAEYVRPRPAALEPGDELVVTLRSRSPVDASGVAAWRRLLESGAAPGSNR